MCYLVAVCLVRHKREQELMHHTSECGMWDARRRRRSEDDTLFFYLQIVCSRGHLRLAVAGILTIHSISQAEQALGVANKKLMQRDAEADLIDLHNLFSILASCGSASPSGVV